MENIMTCPPTRNSIAKEVEICEESVIDIPPEWTECCIYRIPKHLRKVNEEAFTPKLISIGPFHHGADELKDMGKHKERYLKHFFKRRTQKSEEDLRKIIEDNEVEIRHSYSEEFRDINSIHFVKMILLDAIFIIELFLKTEKEEDDYILRKPWLGNGILFDLILLENQLPFFILEKLYMSACCDEGQQTKEQEEDLEKEASRGFVKLSRKYFRWYDKDKEPKSIIDEKVKHLTDLLRYLFCPPNMEQHWKSIILDKRRSQEKSSGLSKKKKKKSSGTRFWQFCSPKMEQHWHDKKEESSESPKKQKEEGKLDNAESKNPEEESFGTRFCATKLDDAGLKFKEVKGGRRLLDIEPPGPGVLRCFPCFRRPMEVPQLVIDDYTETLLRNLMALEQCLYPFQTYICSYVFLLDCLIDTEKDVDLLVHKKVIHNLLGSNMIVADLINKLCNHIVVKTGPPYFDYIGQKLNEHYEYPLNRTTATLKREYFPNVFRGTATVVGLIVLVFTFWNFFK